LCGVLMQRKQKRAQSAAAVARRLRGTSRRVAAV
jgi:hypothetical protein